MNLTPNEALKQALEAHKSGKLQAAERLYRYILASDPRHPDANHNLGVLALQTGNLAKSLPYFKAACEVDKGIEQYWLSYISALIDYREFKLARESLENAKTKGFKALAFDHLNSKLTKEVSSEVEKTETVSSKFENAGRRYNLQKSLRFAEKLLKQNNIERAKSVYMEILDRYPKNKMVAKKLKLLLGSTNVGKSVNDEPNALQMKPVVGLLKKSELKEALIRAQKLECQFPKSLALKIIIGSIFLDIGEFEKALKSCRYALDIDPNEVTVLLTMGKTFKKLNRFDMAISSFEKAITINPFSHTSYLQLGDALEATQDLVLARENYVKAITLEPESSEAHFKLGLVERQKGDFEAALKSFKKTIKISSNNNAALNNVGAILMLQRKFDEAILTFQDCLKIQPDSYHTHYNLGMAFKEKGELLKAMEYYEKAIKINPRFSDAYFNMGNVFYERGKLEKAIQKYEQALEINPKLYSAYCQVLQIKSILCDWSNFDTGLTKSYLNFTEDYCCNDPMPPFAFLHLDASCENHLKLAVMYTNNAVRKAVLPAVKTGSSLYSKLRVGYFSADFKDHPIGQMIEGVLEFHNRDKFQIYAYSFGKQTNDAMRSRIMKSVDVFRDVEAQSGEDIARLARKDNIDIAIDLTGYTRNNKTEIFSNRAAPVQINFLGYPGSMGAEFMDYIIADRILIPKELEGMYSEKIIFMPYTYQPTNHHLMSTDQNISRKVLGLPENKFVFCGINQSYKIKPVEFDIWMRLLENVNSSVLWLKEQNFGMVNNLRQEAELRGVDPCRLIFTRHVDEKIYVAQFKSADLYLDTFNYNAGTTASDVLMAGLPIVTKMGKSYASRMAASLLNAAEMPDLITNTAEQYENLALELAENPFKLNKVRVCLQNKIKTAPIFDTKMYTRSLEAAYQKAYNVNCSGNAVQNIHVKANEVPEQAGVRL